MRFTIFKNKAKVNDSDPDYLVLRRQRTEDDTAYETVQIGTAFKAEMPTDGENYISVSIEGITQKGKMK